MSVDVSGCCYLLQSWKACQRLCNPQGARGLNRRMFEFQPDRVHPEIVARSKEMLLDIDIAKVQAVGPAAITFYVWVRLFIMPRRLGGSVKQ